MSSKSLPKLIAISTGVLTIVCALLGFHQCIAMVEVISREKQMFERFQYFYACAYAMLLVNFLAFVVLAWCGLQQIRVRLSDLRVFIGLFVFELIYALLLGRVFFEIPSIGESVAAAAAVALPRLIFPFFFLFPLWGPLLLVWARKQLARR